MTRRAVRELEPGSHTCLFGRHADDAEWTRVTGATGAVGRDGRIEDVSSLAAGECEPCTHVRAAFTLSIAPRTCASLLMYYCFAHNLSLRPFDLCTSFHPTSYDVPQRGPGLRIKRACRHSLDANTDSVDLPGEDLHLRRSARKEIPGAIHCGGGIACPSM